MNGVLFGLFFHTRLLFHVFFPYFSFFANDTCLPQASVIKL